MRYRLAAALALIASLSSPGRAYEPDEDLVPGLKLHGLLDIRAVRTGKEVSWQKLGWGRLRYGGRDTDGDGFGDRSVVGISVPQASVVLDAGSPEMGSVHVQTNFNSDASTTTPNLGLIEAYGRWTRPMGWGTVGFKAGAFIPPISWEHGGRTWSTLYTVTPSVIGSWVSDEVRALGGELSWDGSVNTAVGGRAAVGVFTGGDQIGLIHWFRGWGLSDYQGDLLVRHGLYSDRASRPLEERDGKLGYYGDARLRLVDRAFEFGGGFWTNNADVADSPSGLSPEAQTYRTRAGNVAAKLELGPVTVLSQYMRLTISALSKEARDWWAGFVMVSVAQAPWRVAGRFERFGTQDWDQGWAFTGDIARRIGPGQEISAEMIHLEADPSQAIHPRPQREQMYLLNYPIRF